MPCPPSTTTSPFARLVRAPRWLAPPLAVAVALALVGCPPAGDNKDEKKAAPKTPTVCAKVGDTCEFSPGKLGSCIQRDDCTTPPCFVCQSQH
jgi:hypothetical protein